MRCEMKRGRTESPFWKRKPLDKMTRAEWESLCDGCGRCCVIKYEDPDTLEVDYTRWACRYLDLETCRCTCYSDRRKRMPECVDLFRCSDETLAWLPSSCAYRLLSGGHNLPDWHPLVTGKAGSTCAAGMSVRGHVIPEAGRGYE